MPRYREAVKSKNYGCWSELRGIQDSANAEKRAKGKTGQRREQRVKLGGSGVGSGIG